MLARMRGQWVLKHAARGVSYIDATTLETNLATLWKLQDAHTVDSATSSLGDTFKNIDFTIVETKSWEKNNLPNKH